MSAAYDASGGEGAVLLSVTGVSGAGKSASLAALTYAFAEAPVTCEEFDSVGVPADADTAWRHGVVEHWVRHALTEQRQGRHMVLCGQVAMGELLAAPTADKLDGIAACVPHCSPDVRRDRLLARGDGPSRLDDHVAFGEWFRRHAADPRHMPHVIRVASPVGMRWERWGGWDADDPRWTFEVIDTDDLTREQAAERVVAWARATLAGRGPMLMAGWAER
jgi:hypothetical protein